MIEKERIGAVVRQFELPGEILRATPYGTGHINDTLQVEYVAGGVSGRCILQRINSHIFRQPLELMQNIARVTAHLAECVVGQPDAERRVLRLIPTRAGGNSCIDAEGYHWRAYHFIENARSYEAVESAEQAYKAARAFGNFQCQLATLPAPRLHDTIPDFHNTPQRFAAFAQALEADVCNRAATARAEIDWALSHQVLAGVLLEAGLPERVTHNDTKFNNVLLDEATGEGICVIDLDTVMPGLALYDFGDMVRTATSPAGEDERDLSKVRMQLPMFEALLRGYVDAASGFLTAEEKRLLPASGKLITFEIGLRFLTDYLSGDTYFKIHRPEHNLDRCRTQFRLVESMEEQEEAMNRLVETVG
ncbi:phosphotransferase enzyme family protein [Telmatobacter bradus]|uniref:phosphotransferase enzyme family protein n=1 Tax=Telmatobacter bradus TaxID=474953 RepID=UPI003B429BB9